MFLFDVSFSLSGGALGAQSVRKGAKMSAKAIKKVVGRHFVERAQTMAAIVREAHGRSRGGPRNNFFRNAVRRPLRKAPEPHSG